MEKVFDDYKYKDVSKKISLKLNQVEDKNLSPWEISNFISNFNTYYYKSEVINTIAIALSKNINPEDIIIFDESFKLNQVHGTLFYLSTKDADIKSLYHIGKPISLFPNKKIFVMNILFKYFRLLNEYIYKINGVKTLDKDNLHVYYNSFTNTSFNKLIQLIKKEIKDNIGDIYLEKSQKENLDNIILNFQSEYEKFNNKFKGIELIKKKLLSSEYDEIDYKGEIFKEYFNTFYHMMDNIQRPIIAVNNKDEEIITILCRAHINKKEENAVTLNLKSVTHNSPISILIEGGVALYNVFTKKNRKDELEEIKEKIEDLKETIQNPEIESSQKRTIELLEKKIEKLTKIENAENLKNLHSIDEIKNVHLRNKIQHLTNKNVEKSTSLLTRNNFKVDLEQTDIYDIDMHL